MVKFKVKRKLEDLNLLDDFLFNSMVMYPGIGEPFCRKILKIIFGREFGKLTIVPQKVVYGSDTMLHGARLDVYLDEEKMSVEAERGSIYDIEPDQNAKGPAVAALPRRVRFYHAVIDAKSLQSGAGYDSLKDVITIIISSYDPFGQDRSIYTIRNMCEEDPEMPYDDGARSIFLYVNGHKGNVSQELRQLLKYMKATTEENAGNKDLQEIQQMIEIVKKDREVSLAYMKAYEHDEMMRDLGRDEGRNEGRNEERKNTERERKRADEAEKKVKDMQDEAEKRAVQSRMQTARRMSGRGIAAEEIAVIMEEDISVVREWLGQR